MRNVLVLGSENCMHSQIIQEYLQFYAADWANIRCHGICLRGVRNELVESVLREDGIRVAPPECLSREEVGHTHWDFVILTKARELSTSDLDQLQYDQILTFAPLPGGAIEADPRRSLVLQREHLKKKVLLFVGKELLPNLQSAGITD